jgi:hypothetical protein
MSKFHCFLELPWELQDEIISHAIPPLIVPCHVLAGSITSAGEHSLLSLKLSCRSIYEAVRRVRWVKASSAMHFSPRPRIFSLDPEKDILRVWEMRLPIFSCSRVEKAGGLPVTRLISMTRKLRIALITWTKSLQQSHLSSFQDKAALVRKLKLDKLPHLQELIIVSQSVDMFWSNTGFWTDNSQHGEGEEPSNESQGQHIGITWEANRTRYPGRVIEFLSSYTNTRMMSRPPNYEPLQIGLHGHTASGDMLGGLWAGFRYFEDSHEVWFSPLTWYEVRDIMMVPTTSTTGDEEALFEEHHSQFVARIWIIRSGQAAPKDEPHHRWTKVEYRYGGGDPQWAYKMHLTWEAIWRMVEEQTYGQELYTLSD